MEESGNELKEQYPDDSKTVENFIRALKEACRARYKKALDGNVEPMKAEARFFLPRTGCAPMRACSGRRTAGMI